MPPHGFKYLNVCSPFGNSVWEGLEAWPCWEGLPPYPTSLILALVVLMLSATRLGVTRQALSYSYSVMPACLLPRATPGWSPSETIRPNKRFLQKALVFCKLHELHLSQR